VLCLVLWRITVFFSLISKRITKKKLMHHSISCIVDVDAGHSLPQQESRSRVSFCVFIDLMTITQKCMFSKFNKIAKSSHLIANQSLKLMGSYIQCEYLLYSYEQISSSNRPAAASSSTSVSPCRSIRRKGHHPSPQ